MLYFSDLRIALYIKKVNEQNETLDEIETILYNKDEVMLMNNAWDRIFVKDVLACVYVTKSMNRIYHNDRPLHGLVLNTENAERDYYFSDGTKMHTEGESLFYLPKGSTYEIEFLKNEGACYCINFDADIESEPFSFVCSKYEDILHEFKIAEKAWRQNDRYRHTLALRTLYSCIYRIQRENERLYLPSKTQQLLAPAMERLKEGFLDNSLTVTELSSLCGMSEVYFRRLFMNCYGMSPKEYMISRRISYAKNLLATGDFSVGEVALLCGYSEPCHFSREFVRRVGVSPREYVEK